MKAAWLEAFSRWVDNGYKVTEGTGPCFKSDGTVFHHRRHYPAYAVDGFSGGAVNAVWLLSKTQFAVSAESHAVLKRALLEMRVYCNLRSFPLALSGRHPDGRGELVPWHYARLAVAGTPDGRGEIDPELAAAYLRVAQGKDAYTRLFAEKGFAPEPSPAGNRVYGYNASVSHRRADWLVTVAGHSRYLWSAEIYQGANHYGRYLTHGSMQLLADGDPVSAFGSGFRQEGWDWRHIPGTTALEIPMERMKADILARAQAVLGYVAKIEAAAPQTVSAYRDRLYAKLQELLGDRQIDEGRLLTEAALFADKVATDEETVRLRSHVASLEEILAGGEAVGRKLDFLVQEFNREANTIGSKCSDVAISKLVVEMKSEIEKMREQVQNIE